MQKWDASGFLFPFFLCNVTLKVYTILPKNILKIWQMCGHSGTATKAHFRCFHLTSKMPMRSMKLQVLHSFRTVQFRCEKPNDLSIFANVYVHIICLQMMRTSKFRMWKQPLYIYQNASLDGEEWKLMKNHCSVKMRSNDCAVLSKFLLNAFEW